MQYNVPEGGFSSQANDPHQIWILELQRVIDAYHKADSASSWTWSITMFTSLLMNLLFERIVPGYFYRYDHDRQRTNGTFCGNDVAVAREPWFAICIKQPSRCNGSTSTALMVSALVRMGT
ncbi:MAG: hypothetical protein ACLVJN_10265 [Streptococcus parasanguinis]